MMNDLSDDPHADLPDLPNAAPENSPTAARDGRDEDPASSRWQERAIIVLLVLFAVPFLFNWGKGEIAKWYLAAASDAQFRGDRAAALTAANRAAQWDPDSSRIQSTRASMLLSVGDAQGAAEVADRELNRSRQEYDDRASTINHLLLASSLNQSAYCHALALTDLEVSLSRINEALSIREMLPKDDGYASMLDTRGYLRYLVAKKRRDDPDAEEPVEQDSVPVEKDEEPISEEERYQQTLADALADLETAVAIYKQALKIKQAGIENDARLAIDHAPLKFQRRSLDESMSVLLHHRGLIYQAVGKVVAAEKDLEQAKRLGYDPENGVW